MFAVEFLRGKTMKQTGADTAILLMFRLDFFLEDPQSIHTRDHCLSREPFHSDDMNTTKRSCGWG